GSEVQTSLQFRRALSPSREVPPANPASALRLPKGQTTLPRVLRSDPARTLLDGLKREALEPPAAHQDGDDAPAATDPTGDKQQRHATARRVPDWFIPELLF